MESYGIRGTSSGAVPLDRGAGTIDPRAAKCPMPPSEQEKERLSAIIQELNDRFGAGLTEKDRISLEQDPSASILYTRSWDGVEQPGKDQRGAARRRGKR